MFYRSRTPHPSFTINWDSGRGERRNEAQNVGFGLLLVPSIERKASAQNRQKQRFIVRPRALACMPVEKGSQMIPFCGVFPISQAMQNRLARVPNSLTFDTF